MRTSTVGPTRRALHAALNWIYPPSCPLCHRTLWRPGDREVCGDCASDLKRIAPPYCPTCGRPFAVEPTHLCGDCELSPPPYRRMRAPFVYDGGLRRAILSLKYHGETGRAADLAMLLLTTEQMGLPWEAYDLVVPVPLHDRRIRARGFNQCTLLVREVARRRKIVWTDRAVVRVKETRPQFELSEPERIENVRGAFECPEPGAIQGATILLVEDIVSSGSTVNACAKTLKKAGVSVVDVAVLARAGASKDVMPESP